MTSLLNIQINEKTISETQKETTAVLTFKENPYFSNSELKVTVKLENDMPKTSTASPIQWKEGKNLTVKTVSKSQKNKKTGAKRQVNKEIKCKSFFGLFREFTDKDAEESYNEEEEEQPNIYLLNDTLEQLLDVVPFSLEYYLGVVEVEDPEGDEEFEDEEEEEEDKKKSTHCLPRTGQSAQ